MIKLGIKQWLIVASNFVSLSRLDDTRNSFSIVIHVHTEKKIERN